VPREENDSQLKEKLRVTLVEFVAARSAAPPWRRLRIAVVK
jgi:hypothetical protein